MVTVHVQRPVMEKPEAKELKPRDCPCFLDCPQVVLKVGLTSGISFCWCHKSCGRSRPYLGGFRNKVTDSMSEAKMGVGIVEDTNPQLLPSHKNQVRPRLLRPQASTMKLRVAFFDRQTERARERESERERDRLARRIEVTGMLHGLDFSGEVSQ